ncbi:lysophospholipid acyltransferase family protein [Brevibacterium litoralis]|uniref:lysophospholipid acyltransferase family protein n=1 Tax=Brevibacterium litoralis TaxID=3138935 RepID=UPI0032EDAE19
MTDTTGNAPVNPSEEPADLDLTSFDEDAITGHYRNAGWVAPPLMVGMRAFGRTATTGVENLRMEGPVIVAAYHASYLDPLVVGIDMWKRGRLPHFLAKSGLFTGFIGTVLRGVGQIPVLRGSKRAVDSLHYARRALAAGEAVVVYPQGTVTKDPDLWPEASKTGLARLALVTGAPIVPVVHWGLDSRMPVGAKIPRPHPRHTTLLHYGEEIHYEDIADGEAPVHDLTDRITSHLAAHLARLSGRPMPQRFVAALQADPHVSTPPPLAEEEQA